MRLVSTRSILTPRAAIAALGLLLTGSPAHAQPSDPAPAPGASPAGVEEPPPPAAEAPAPAPAPTTTSTLHGRIADESGRAPLPGATVSIPALGVVVFTDENGEFTIQVPAGEHAVRIELQGYFARDQRVAVQGATAELAVQLAEDRLGEVISIVGSRTPRSRLETSVPVDVITSDVITESSHTETNQILNMVAPSFNASRQAIVDGTDHIDPADLRGLGPEHVLVLINGRRLHQSALINVYGGGTVGIDLNAIPTSAIARIEVLRDGAASQYGSDAIAGVINIVLKEEVDAVHLYSMTGITAENDGEQFKLGGNAGLKLGDRGFLHLTGELFLRGRTNRSKAWTGDIFPGIEGQAATDAELMRRNLSRDDFKLSVGQSGAVVGTAFVNAGYKIDDTFQLHADGGYTFRQGYASGFYRLPNSEDQVDLRIYPNGFLPEINPRIQAWTGTVGVRGKRGAWEGDLSLTHGGDSFHYFIDNSLNASLGQASPRHFDAGALHYTQTSLNLDGVRRINQSVLKAFSVVAGTEVRRETYGIDAGQPESYELGPEVTVDGKPKLPGAQVFPGFRPTDASDNSRRSEAIYAGIESQPSARTSLDLGGRFEHYSDFGNTVIGKIAGRVAVVKSGDNEVALRGAASTGFRAPGLQQLWYSTIATQFVNDPVTNIPTPTNILVSPNRSQVTEAFGVPHLKEETSVNFSGGFTARVLGNLSLSADYYRVTIKDRVVLSGQFNADNDSIGSAIANILAPFPGVSAAQFFVNAVDTTTNGVDLVIDHSYRLPKGSLKTTAAANFTHTAIDTVRVPKSIQDRFSGVDGGADKVAAVFLGRYGRNLFEDLLPRQKGTLGVRWDYDGWSVGLRANYFGPTEYHSDLGEELDESFGAKVIFDVDLGKRIGGLWWSVGANNVLNTFPDEVKNPANRLNDSFLYSPAAYSAGAPYGTNGGFYYVRAEYQL